MTDLTDLVRLVRLQAVHRVAVFVREHRNGPGTQFVGGTERADGDFAAVGDEDFGEHGKQSTLPRGVP